MSGRVIFVTNDDGIDAPGIQALVRRLRGNGHIVVIVAPDRERSASTMHITMHRPLRLVERSDLEEHFGGGVETGELWIYQLDGYPADCVLTGLGGGLPDDVPSPCLCVTGINRGPNLSVDVLHSGTIGSARQAAIIGLPSIAASYDTFQPESFDEVADATIELVEKALSIVSDSPPNFGREEGARTNVSGNDADQRVLDGFRKGEVFLNLNVPVGWDGSFQTCRLGSRWYRDPIVLLEDGDKERVLKLGATWIEDEPIEDGDSYVKFSGVAAVSALSTWPATHPLSIGENNLRDVVSGEGLPRWMG